MATVLVVDDNPMVRTVLAEVVAGMGHRVTEAADGRAAIVHLGSTVFDLVITDVVMPEADGLEVIKALRRGGGRTPVIAISGGTPSLPAGYALKMTEMFDADAVLFKPFGNEELEAAVTRLLDRDA